MDERTLVSAGIWGVVAMVLSALIAYKLGAGFTASISSILLPLIFGAIAGALVHYLEYDFNAVGAGISFALLVVWLSWLRSGVLHHIAFGKIANEGLIPFPAPWYDTEWFAWLTSLCLAALIGFFIFRKVRDR